MVMVKTPHQLGRDCEALAAAHLKKAGYRILERNYRSPLGEIDIIAKEQNTLVFVEVKARRSLRYGSAKLALTPAKQRTLSKVALYYLKARRLGCPKARFDVVAVDAAGREPRLEIVRNAFGLAYR